jgi:hypothetical protein
MMYFCLLLSSFVALYSGQTFCVYMGCTDIDYCIYDICGLWMVLVFFHGYVYGYVYGCVWVCVWVMCMDTGSRSSARPGSINVGAYLSLGPVSIIIGTYSLHEARLNDSPNFSNFSRQKWKNLPQYAVSNKFF